MANKVRTALCKHVPHRAEEVLQWTLAVYEKGGTIEDFAASGAFPSPDVELTDAVIGIVSGNLAREINAFVDAQERRPQSGSHVLGVARRDPRVAPNPSWGQIGEG